MKTLFSCNKYYYYYIGKISKQTNKQKKQYLSVKFQCAHFQTLLFQWYDVISNSDLIGGRRLFDPLPHQATLFFFIRLLGYCHSLRLGLVRVSLIFNKIQVHIAYKTGDFFNRGKSTG